MVNTDLLVKIAVVSAVVSVVLAMALGGDRTAYVADFSAWETDYIKGKKIDGQPMKSTDITQTMVDKDLPLMLQLKQILVVQNEQTMVNVVLQVVIGAAAAAVSTELLKDVKIVQ